jgi:hypothetical protein
MKNTLTAATGAVVPFQHSLFDEGGVSKLALGYAHRGMVVPACWIARGITPCFLHPVNAYSTKYRCKIRTSSYSFRTEVILSLILSCNVISLLKTLAS